MKTNKRNKVNKLNKRNKTNKTNKKMKCKITILRDLRESLVNKKQILKI
jgi:hypothetical protein